jgi:hypothetical protein
VDFEEVEVEEVEEVEVILAAAAVAAMAGAMAVRSVEFLWEPMGSCRTRPKTIRAGSKK